MTSRTCSSLKLLRSNLKQDGQKRMICTSSLRRPFALPSQQLRLQRLSASQQIRHASSLGNYFANLRQVGRDQMRQNPVIFPVALLIVLLTSSGVIYAGYLNIKVRAEMGNYPENVGTKLRRAIYFTDHAPDPAQAMRAYLGALKLAQDEKMHPLSNEVLGIYLKMADFLEKTGNVKEAVELLENSRLDCLRYIEEHEGEPGFAPSRSRLLQRSIQIAHKIGELFSSPYYPSREKAEEYLTWAVETALKENQRRANEGLQAGEGEIISQDQQGAALEALGHHYEELDNHHYASQLFLQALRIKPAVDCHTVVLMNNLAAALAQQSPPPEPGLPPPSRAELCESGRAWARKALELGRSIKPPERTQECDAGCAVATHNLGEFAEMDGDVRAARGYYEEAGSLAHAIGFEEGVVAADAALARLDSGGRSAPKNRSR